MGEQRLGVAPHTHLPPRQRGADHDHQHAGHGNRGTPATPGRIRGEPVGHGPGQHDEQPRQRQVGEAVGHGLRAGLHEPDHGHERADEPEPAHDQVRAASDLQQQQDRDDRQEHRRAEDCLAAPLQVFAAQQIRMGIDSREIHGPDRLADIEGVGHDRIGQAVRNGQHIRAEHRAPLPLHGDRRDAARQRQREQGKLLEDQVADRARRVGFSGRIVSRSRLGLERADAPQRPVVQQQQQERPRHEHRFGQQAQPQGDEHQRVACEPAPPGVPRVRAEGQQREQAAEHVLAFGDPRHGLDVQRVQGKQGGDERAAPEAARHHEHHPIHQQRVDHVQYSVDDVMARGVETEQFAIDQVRHAGQRMPVAVVGVGEHPLDALGGEALADHGVLRDIVRIVEVKELEAADAAEHHSRDDREQQQDGQMALHADSI